MAGFAPTRLPRQPRTQKKPGSDSGLAFMVFHIVLNNLFCLSCYAAGLAPSRNLVVILMVYPLRERIRHTAQPDCTSSDNLSTQTRGSVTHDGFESSAQAKVGQSYEALDRVSVRGCFQSS